MLGIQVQRLGKSGRIKAVATFSGEATFPVPVEIRGKRFREAGMGAIGG